jgi:hypothetical protein
LRHAVEQVVRRKRSGPAEDRLVYDSTRPIIPIVKVAFYLSLHILPTVLSTSHSGIMAQGYIVTPKSPPDLNIPEGNVAVKVSCIDR